MVTNFLVQPKKLNRFCQKLVLRKIPRFSCFSKTPRILKCYLSKVPTKFTFPPEKILKFKIDELFRILIVYTVYRRKKKHSSLLNHYIHRSAPNSKYTGSN